MNRRTNLKGNVDFQTPGSASAVEEKEEETEEEQDKEQKVKVLREMESGLGEICQGFFTIKVTKQEKNPETKKMEVKVLYENKKEPFEYPRLFSLANAIRHAAKNQQKDSFKDMTDEQIDALGTAIPESFGPAVSRVTKVYNDRLKADAKSSQYNSLVTKYRPLDEEEKEVAIAKTVRNLVKIAPHFSVETVIEMLKGQKAIPEDYTVEDFNATKMRKTRGADEDEDEE